MSGIREIRKQISSISATRKITSAMEMVAASKMRRSQQRMREARPYSEHILKVVQHVASATPQYRPFLLRERPAKRCAWILISTDKGLCGGLNQNLFRLFLKRMEERMQTPGTEVRTYPLGAKAHALCQRLKLPSFGIEKLGENPEIADVLKILQPLLDGFEAGDIDRIYLMRNRFVSAISQLPEQLQLAPATPPDNVQKMPWDYIYEPAPEALLDSLLRRYIEALVYEALIENHACEQAAKMVAMKNATDNAGELIEDLELAYNNARQASITSELADIIGGAEAV